MHLGYFNGGRIFFPHPAPLARGLAGLGLLFSTLAHLGCTPPQPEVKIPERVLYLEAQVLEDKGLFSEADTKYQQVVTQNSGSRLATFSHLKSAEIKMRQEEWRDAETNFKLFLSANSNSHLTSFVLFQLLRAHHENSYTGLFFRGREIDRDMEPNRQTISEFQRLYFLYPNSRYLKEARVYYRSARETLADHELLVADYYYRHGLYNAAASRYLYLLRNFPEYPHSTAVLDRLIESYRRNQQPELAGEMERFRSQQSGASVTQPSAGGLVARESSRPNSGAHSE